MKLTSQTVKPRPHPFYGDSYERGLDPWHEDAFPKEFKQVGTKGKRLEGWFLIDGAGNAIGFVPDGSEVGLPPQGMLVVVETGPKGTE